MCYKINGAKAALIKGCIEGVMLKDKSIIIYDNLGFRVTIYDNL